MKLISPKKLPDLNYWLTTKNLPNSNNKKYSLILLEEDLSCQNQIIPQLKQVAQQAICDLRDLIIEVRHVNLDPLDAPEIQSAKSEFLEKLDQFLTIFDSRTLQGYFGETLAGLIVLGYNPFGISDWKIPVFLYRHHIHAYDAFEKWRQSGELPIGVIGRPGEDNIAFLWDSEGKIVKELRCESKCTSSHSSNLISDAHKKFNDNTLTSPEIFRIQMILENCESDPVTNDWIKALGIYQWSKNEPSHLICYVCQDTPKRADRTTWMDCDNPHAEYKSSRPLQVVEVHVNDVAYLIRTIYNQKTRP